MSGKGTTYTVEVELVNAETIVLEGVTHFELDVWRSVKLITATEKPNGALRVIPFSAILQLRAIPV